MNEMTLPSRFEIRALAVRIRPHHLSITEAPHSIESLQVNGEDTFYFSETWRPEWGSNPRSRLFKQAASKQAALTNAPGPPPKISANLRRYTGFQPNSTRPPLTRSPGHIEKGDTRIFLWKPNSGSAGLQRGTHSWPARQSGALPKHHVPSALLLVVIDASVYNYTSNRLRF